MKISIQNPVSRIAIHKASIMSNRNIKDSYFEIIIYAPEIAKYAQPGQFVNIKVSDSLEPLLRRPLSIHRVSLAPCAMRHASKNHNTIAILYEIVGRGTESLSKRKPGEYLDVIGPLGNGFVLDAGRLPVRQAGKTQDARRILVAGGMGTAPLLFLAETLCIKYQVSSIKVLIGAKTKKDILCEDEFRQLGCEVKIATDDGSRGFKGKVTGLLNKILRLAISDKRLAIYGCGPAPMLKEISLISRKYHIPAQISLEAHMACGIGACMGCVIKVKSQKSKAKSEWEYKRVCKEGPVFEASQIIW